MIKDHDKIKELISSYIDGAVSEQERREVEDLILNEKQWQDYYKELQKLSGTLQEWRDEEVSADMANEIQKTLLDEKLQEGANMKSDTWLKVGGGAFVTFAICMIIGIVYLRTFSQEAREDYISEKQTIDRSAVYEPYFQSVPEQETIASDYDAEETVGSVPGDASGYFVGAKGRVGAKDVAKESAFDLAASYEEVSQKAGEAVTSKVKKSKLLQDESIRIEKKNDRRQTGGFQASSYDTRLGLIHGLGDPPVRESESPYIYEQNVQPLVNSQAATPTESVSRARANAGFQVQEMAANGEYDKEVSYGDRLEGARSFSKISSLRKQERRIQPSSAVVYEDFDNAEERKRRDVGRHSYRPAPIIADDMVYPPYPETPPQRRYKPRSTEEYDPIYENPFLMAQTSPLSTFSVDVDTASYSNVRRFLEQGQLPPANAVRIEEMVNYFEYNYPTPRRGEPFSVNAFGAVCPWNPRHVLVQVGLKGNVPDQNKIPPSNLVFLIDVSGSMNRANKLPLLKRSLKLMVDQLRNDQHVAIVTYSGSARLVLDSTSGAYKNRIHAAIDNLSASGSTAGEAGLRLAYRIARKNYIRNGNNRVILASDGDFNVGMQNDHDLVHFIQGKKEEGVFLSILGFGTGNYKDSKMEKIANNGNGNYHYIDSYQEGRKVLVNELGSTLFTIAKDVKIQVEFNPQHVQAYRLIGYENRVLTNRDFNNDRVDAGEIGAGHTVTALYEVVPTNGGATPYHHERGVDRLKYQKAPFWINQELMTLKLRYKPVKSNRSRLIKKVVKRSDVRDRMNADLAFASAVAEFGMLLRNSRFKGNASYDRVLQRASQARGSDLQGRRGAFLRMVEKAKRLDHRSYYPRHPYPEPYTGYQVYPAEELPQMQFK